MQDRRGLKANDRIADKEYIGRRLAAKTGLVGAIDQIRTARSFDLRDFQERRPPHELSLDWLGRTGLDSKVLRSLGDQAATMFSGQKPPRRFAGWVYLQAVKITKAHKDFPCDLLSFP